MMIEQLLNQVKNDIEKRFPTVSVMIERLTDKHEYFVLIDKKEIYESIEYMMFVTNISLNLLLPKGAANIFFSYMNNYAMNLTSTFESLSGNSGGWISVSRYSYSYPSFGVGFSHTEMREEENALAKAA